MCNGPLLNNKKINNVPKVILPDYITMKATHIGIISTLSRTAKERIDFSLPDVEKPLVPMPAAHDEEGEARCTKKEVHESCKASTILKEERGTSIGSWLVPI